MTLIPAGGPRILYIGLDVDARSFTVRVLDSHGQVLFEQPYGTSAQVPRKVVGTIARPNRVVLHQCCPSDGRAHEAGGLPVMPPGTFEGPTAF